MLSALIYRYAMSELCTLSPIERMFLFLVFLVEGPLLVEEPSFEINFAAPKPQRMTPLMLAKASAPI